MIKSAVSLKAHAKINLHLEVLGKRSDGFHDLVSVFAPISLADELLMQRIPDKKECKVLSPLAELPVENTITRAYEEFKNFTGISEGVSVRILKRIPEGAGLGGGSSDAASVLLGLNDMFSSDLKEEDLRAIALKIGSDVPFFLKESAGVVTGRGELFEPIQARTDCFGILIWPDVQSSTKEAYSLLDQQKGMLSGEHEAWGYEKLVAQYQAPFKVWRFVNDFQPVLEQRYPVIAQARKELYEQGAEFAQMSGSGSAVFGLFGSENLMTSAFQTLLKRWRWCKPFLLLA